MRGFDLLVAGLDCVSWWRGEVVAVGINGGLGSGEAEEGRRAGSGLGSGADEDIDTESVPSRFRPGCGVRVGFSGPTSAAAGLLGP